MKRLLMLGFAFAAGLFTSAARGDVDVQIGIGVPQVVIGTNRPPHRDYRPPVRHRHDYGPPLRRHRHYGPPAMFFPEHVYRHPQRHYRDKRYGDAHLRQHLRPPAHWHLQRNQRPLRPPHAYSQGQWHR